MKAAAVRQISNDNGEIYLFDLYKDEESFYYEPILVFNNASFESCWDNSEYVFNFLRGIYKNKKSTKKELKNFCKENKFDYKNTKKDLLDIFKTSKQLKFWNE